MARNPAPISAKAAALWAAGDETAASKLSKLQPRQLRNRLGAPGRKPPTVAAVPAGEAPAAPEPQKLVRVASRPIAEPSTPPPPALSPAQLSALCAVLVRLPMAQRDDAVASLLAAYPAHVADIEAAAKSATGDPSAADIEAIDTLDEARKVLHEIREKMPTADEVRFASLAEKALSAINRIEQIEARRPRAPARDEVTARLVAIRDAAIARMGILTSDAAAKLAEDRVALAAWCAQELAPRVAAEMLAKVDAMLGGPT